MKIFKKILICFLVLFSMYCSTGIIDACVAGCSWRGKWCTPVDQCGDCSWCLPQPTGIHNPALDRFGTGEGAEILAKIFAQILSVAFILGGVFLLLIILWSGISWMGAGGDQNKLKGAQNRLTNAIVGFIILVALRAILGFIAGVLEISWLETLKITWPTP